MVLKSLVFLLLSAYCHSACISGDCENGKGIFETAMNFDGAVLLGHSDHSRIESFKCPKTADFVSGFQKSLLHDGMQFSLLARTHGFVSSRYDGDFQLGKRHGQGKEVYTVGDLELGVYVGGFVEDKRSGHGVYVWHEQAQRYEGDWLEDVPHGWGKRQRKDGTLYTGQYRFGWEEGIGLLTDQAGENYQGEWLKGKKCGRGRLSTPGTEVGYVGQWQNDVKHGFGVELLPDGSVYQGEYANDLPNGMGVYNMSDDSRYEGEWKDDRKHGWGTLFYASGGKYEGEWKDEEKHGYGKETYWEGSVYEGVFKNGLPNGYGVYDISDGRRYEGFWKDDMQHGKGVYTWPSGKRYDGEWFEDRIEGQGTFVWPDQSRHEGQFKAGLPHGYGVYTWAKGGRHEGMYRKGKKHGYGKYEWPGGSKYEGMWALDKRHGYGVFTFRDGDVYAGEWEQDSPACKLDFVFKLYRQKWRATFATMLSAFGLPQSGYTKQVLHQKSELEIQAVATLGPAGCTILGMPVNCTDSPLQSI